MPQNSLHSNDNIQISPHHLLYFALVIFSILAGVILLMLPDKLEMILILLIPAAIALVFIFRNPLYGIYLGFLYEYLRPYDFIPALHYLRLAMIIGATTLISWLVHLAIKRKNIQWDFYNLFFVFFLIVIATGVFFAENNRNAFNVFQDMLGYFVVFLIATNVVDNFDKLKKLIWLLLTVHLYLSIQGIANYVIGNPVGTSGAVSSGFLADENDYAMAINVMIPFAYFIYYASKTTFQRYFSITILISFIIAIMCSFSRGGWVGLIVALFMCIYLSRKRMMAISVVLFISIPLLLFAPSKYWNEMQTITDTSESTADARIRYWQSAYHMYLDYPIVGVGAGNGGVKLPEYAIGYQNPWTQWGRAFHGTFPQVMAELGTLGLLSYFLLIFYMFRYMGRIRKRGRQEKRYQTSELFANSVIASTASYFAAATFLSTAYYPQFWTIITIGIITYFCHHKNIKEKEINQNDNRDLENSVIGIR